MKDYTFNDYRDMIDIRMMKLDMDGYVCLKVCINNDIL